MDGTINSENKEARSASLARPDVERRLWFSSAMRSVIRIGPVWWMLIDAGLAFVSLKLAYDLSPKASNYVPPMLHLILFPILAVLAGNITGLYEKDILINKPKLLVAVFFMSIFAPSILAMFSTIILFEPVGRYVLLIASGLMLLTCGGTRLVGSLAASRFPFRLLLIGNRNEASSITQQIERYAGHYALKGFCEDDSVAPQGAAGTTNDIPQICSEKGINIIIVMDRYIRNPHVLDKCFQSIPLGCKLMDECTFFEEAFEQVLVDKIDASWFYTAKLGLYRDIQTLLKRAMDIVLAVIGLTITAILFPIIWCLIRFTSPGPAIYSQVRSGQFERPFTIYKFRTMRIDAEKNGAQWASKQDSRITPVGKFLRKTRFDEILQFWNILKGDMSFVGPRPERPIFVKELEEKIPFFPFRQWAKPGLTGLAQIRHPYGSSIEDAKQKLQHDLYYIKNWSILLDIQIMLRTILTIMKGSR